MAASSIIGQWGLMGIDGDHDETIRDRMKTIGDDDRHVSLDAS